MVLQSAKPITSHTSSSLRYILSIGELKETFFLMQAVLIVKYDIKVKNLETVILLSSHRGMRAMSHTLRSNRNVKLFKVSPNRSTIFLLRLNQSYLSNTTAQLQKLLGPCQRIPLLRWCPLATPGLTRLLRLSRTSRRNIRSCSDNTSRSLIAGRPMFSIGGCGVPGSWVCSRWGFCWHKGSVDM